MQVRAAVLGTALALGLLGAVAQGGHERTRPSLPTSPPLVPAPGVHVAAAPRTLPAMPVLRPVPTVAGEHPNVAYVRRLSVERYERFMATAAPTAEQRAQLDAALAEVCADLDAARAELETARREGDPDSWFAFQDAAFTAGQDELNERITAILTPAQLAAVGGEGGIRDAFPASSLAGLGGLLK